MKIVYNSICRHSFFLVLLRSLPYSHSNIGWIFSDLGVGSFQCILFFPRILVARYCCWLRRQLSDKLVTNLESFKQLKCWWVSLPLSLTSHYLDQESFSFRTTFSSSNSKLSFRLPESHHSWILQIWKIIKPVSQEASHRETEKGGKRRRIEDVPTKINSDEVVCYAPSTDATCQRKKFFPPTLSL